MKHSFYSIGAIVIIAFFLLPTLLRAQAIPMSLQYTEVYDFVDELITDGIINRQTAVKPYTRLQIAQMLTEAQEKDSLLNRRQTKALEYYLNQFALERDTMFRGYVQYSDKRTFSLSLANPQFSYMTKNKLFKMSIEPILGMDIYGGVKGAITKRWWGAELRMDIAKHLSIWGSLRDVSYNGDWLRSKYYASSGYTDPHCKQGGAMITRPYYLNNLPGTEYKEADYGGDFSDSKGGIMLYAWFGSIGLQREQIRWGDSYHCSNILSGHNPAVPMLTIQLTPCKWFQFDYFHAWLISNVLDSTSYFLENTTVGTATVKNYRPSNKFMAANMFTFIPVKQLSFSFGNSIVYSENNPQAAYFIPIAFYKSLDHLLTKGASGNFGSKGTENQNSQVFASVSVRPVDHLQLYGSFYIDEFSVSRLKKGNDENNPFSYLVGFNWSGWPLRGFSLKGEFMRSYIACYTHSIDVLTWASNGYNMGHYMGDNAQSIHLELAYRPIRGLRVSLSYTNDTKYNSYNYLRDGYIGSNRIREGGISQTLAQKPFDKAIYKNDEIVLSGVYEAHPNLYLRASITYNNARAFDNTTSNIKSENTNTAQGYLDAFIPYFWQSSTLGERFTAMVGLSFGF